MTLQGSDVQKHTPSVGPTQARTTVHLNVAVILRAWKTLTPSNGVIVTTSAEVATVSQRDGVTKLRGEHSFVDLGYVYACTWSIKVLLFMGAYHPPYAWTLWTIKLCHSKWNCASVAATFKCNWCFVGRSALLPVKQNPLLGGEVFCQQMCQSKAFTQ